MSTLRTKLVIRNDTTINWTTVNPILLKGELGIETDTNRMKIGNGTANWTSLSYFDGTFSITGTGNTIINATYNATTKILTLTKGYRVTANQDTSVLRSDTTWTSDNTYVPTTKAIDDKFGAIANAAMIMRGTLGTGGTVTALPTAALGVLGDAYKVITAGTYSGETAKIGDVFVCYESGTNTYAWMLIPSGDDIEDTWRPVKLDSADKLGSGLNTGALILKNVAAKGISIEYNNGFEFDVKTNYTDNDKNYHVQKDSSGNLFVNVPWNNSIYTVVSNSTNGLAPKIVNSGGSTIGTQTSEWVLTSNNGATPTWKRLPVNAFSDNNTTYGADRGISLANNKFGHSNTAITAQTIKRLYGIAYDTYGHITNASEAILIIDGGSFSTSDWGTIID